MTKLQAHPWELRGAFDRRWSTTRLSEICSIIYGYTDSASNEPIGPHFLRITDIQDDRVEWSTVPYCRIADDKVERYKLETGDIVFSRTGATTGKSYLVSNPPEAVFASYLIRLRLSEQSVLPEFVNYYFQTSTYWRVIAEGSVGSAQGGFNASKLGNLVIPLPPKNEQERIVTVLDDAFEGIATAKKNAEQNLANASSLFAAARSGHLIKAVSNPERKALGEIAEVQSGGTPLISTESYWNGDIPWYSSGELNDTYTSEPKRCISQQGLNRSNAKIFPKGSLLVGMYDTAALKMSVLDRDASFNQAIAGVKPNDSLETLFVLHSINSQKEYILSGRRGTRQKNLSLAKIKEISITLPPLEVQRQIVELIEQDATVSESLVEVYRQKIQALADLKLSLLDQAFSGNL